MLRERRRHANYKPNRRLDRKSSRGMIYENEELRLRTININAEVERGQSDIRKLRRENEQLKREIWSLRDEYDRVNKKACANKNCSSCENISNSDSQSEDSDYCEVCRDHEPPFDGCHQHGTDEDEQHDLEHEEKTGLATGEAGAVHSIQATYGSMCGTSKEAAENYENAQKTLTQTGVMTLPPTTSLTQLSTFVPSTTPPPLSTTHTTASAPGMIASTSAVGFGSSLASSSMPFGLSDSTAAITTTTSTTSTRHNCKVPASVDSVSSKLRENLHVNFGQLSVLSEETLTNSDGASSVHEGADQDATLMMMMMQSMALDDSTTSIREIQSILPPLSHFENIPYECTSPSSPDRTTTDLTAMADECRVNPNECDFTSKQLMSRSLDGSSSCADQQQGYSKTTTTTANVSNVTPFRSPKHFFSPINPRLKAAAAAAAASSIIPQPSTSPILATALYPNPPDLFVANALASPCHRPVISMESVPMPPTQQQPFMASVIPVPVIPVPSVIPVPHNSDSSFYEGNLEDLLFEIETLQIQLEKHKSQSQEKLPTNYVEPFATNTLTRPKPYRSEMNLVVSCNGCKSSITPITKQTSASLTTGFDYKSDTAVYSAHGVNNNNSHHTNTNSSSFDTPPPNIPQPMILFPQNLTYLTRDNCEHGGSVPVLTEIGSMASDYHQFHHTQAHMQPLPQQRMGAPMSMQPTDLVMRQKKTMMAAPVATTPTSDNLDDGRETASVMAAEKPATNTDTEVVALKEATKAPSDLPNITGSEALTTTAKRLEMKKTPASNVRRKWFSTQRDDSEDSGNKQAATTCESSAANVPIEWTAETTGVVSDNLQNDSSSSSDTTKRKNPRRISISFSDTKKSSSADEKSERLCDRKTEENTLTNKVTTSQMGTSLTNDLHTAHSKQNSQNSSSGRSACCDLVTQSTPNSPQFGARRTSSSASHSHHHHNHHHHHHSGSGTTTTMTGTGTQSGTTASHHHCTRKLSDADSTRYAHKCSRRYSEGTVDTLPHSSFGSAYATSNYGGSAIVGRHATTAVVATNLNEGGVGVAVPTERNSNSFASSRESSTSQSTHHSQRRKISVSSHNGGKIPWCGCWGNGCL